MSLFTNKKYLKAKVRQFDGVIKTNFLGNDIPNKNMFYASIACITIDSVMRIDKKSAGLFRRVKKIQMSKFINTELKPDSNSELDSENGSKFDAELMTKLKSGSDSEWDILLIRFCWLWRSFSYAYIFQRGIF